MGVKELVLKELERTRDRPLSGQLLSERLGVSRTAVWKAVENLRKEGYTIDAKSNAGYLLQGDRMSKEGIALFLDRKDVAVYYYNEIDSTNDEAKRIALPDGKKYGLFVSESQSKGKGRMGRSFFSPKDGGIFLSLLLPGQNHFEDAVLITSAAAVAVCRAVSEQCGIELGIKWVNDLYLDEKKVCGILTEAVSNFELQTLENIVIGIGLNYTIPDEAFPEELRDRAGSLYSEGIAKVSRNQMAAAIADELIRILQPQDKSMIEEYRARSIVLGKDIVYNMQGIQREGRVLAIDDNAALHVRDVDGKTHVLASGEITVSRFFQASAQE